jgi:hypothetical protein
MDLGRLEWPELEARWRPFGRRGHGSRERQQGSSDCALVQTRDQGVTLQGKVHIE